MLDFIIDHKMESPFTIQMGAFMQLKCTPRYNNQDTPYHRVQEEFFTWLLK